MLQTIAFVNVHLLWNLWATAMGTLTTILMLFQTYFVCLHTVCLDA
jgi:hypothetical protein